MGLFPKDRNLAAAPDRLVLPVRASDFRASPAEFEIRLDAFVHHHLRWRSRTSVQRLIRDGYVLLEQKPPERHGEPASPREERRVSEKLRHGARVTVIIPEVHRVAPLQDAPGALLVLHEDEETLAIDKPAGLPVHPSGRHLSDSLIQRVHARYRSGGELESVPIRLCHRLDRETSGIVLLGKGDLVHRRLMRQFERREIEKEYLAIVEGEPGLDEGVIELSLGTARASRVRLKMTVRADGSPARTEWRVLERRRGCALVACRLVTGRQHQIRVHLAAIGHPIVGDKLYGADEELFVLAASGELTPRELAELELPRHALHAHRLAWRSPLRLERREVESPLPSDLRAFLDAR